MHDDMRNDEEWRTKATGAIKRAAIVIKLCARL